MENKNDVTVVITDSMEASKVDLSAFSHQKQYEFICEFAEGGMGKIGKLKDLIFERYVAGKTVKPELMGRPDILQSFIAESKLMAQLDHPGIVPVYSLGKDDGGCLQLVMKLVNGISLKNYINNARKEYSDLRTAHHREPLRLKVRLEYITKICEVIEYAHSLKIVHGDIKPENILLGNFGETYVMDWGCAGYIGSKPEHIAGTPLYLPPEYLQERVITEGIDVFAIGVLLYEMVTLRRLHEDTMQSTEKLVSANNNGKLIPKHYFPDIKVPGNLLAIISKAMAANPAERYHSVGDLRADLRRFIYNEEVLAAPDNLFQKLFRVINHNRMRSVLIALLLILLLMGGWFVSSWRNWQKEEKLRRESIQSLQLQIGTGSVVLAATQKLTQAQSQLLIMADNIVEDINEPIDHKGAYTNEDFTPGGNPPPDLLRSDYYSQEISLGHIVRVGQPQNAKELPKPDSAQMVKLFRKVIYYDRQSSFLSDSTTAGNFLLTPENMIQHLFVLWNDGVLDVYPGRFVNDAKRKDFMSLESLKTEIGLKSFFWTPFFYGQNGLLRLTCMYSMFDYNNRFIGLAGISLRADVVFQALIKANRETPLDEFFIVTVTNQVINVDQGKLRILAETAKSDNGFTAAQILDLKTRIVANGMNQFSFRHNGRNYRIAARQGVILHSLILNIVDTTAFTTGTYKYGSL